MRVLVPNFIIKFCQWQALSKVPDIQTRIPNPLAINEPSVGSIPHRQFLCGIQIYKAASKVVFNIGQEMNFSSILFVSKLTLSNTVEHLNTQAKRPF